GEGFQQRLHALAGHPLVGDTRGVGLIGALEIVADKKTRKPFAARDGVAQQVMRRCEENGLIVRALGDNVALCPPLIITDAQVDELFTKLEKSLDETLAAVR